MRHPTLALALLALACSDSPTAVTEPTTYHLYTVGQSSVPMEVGWYDWRGERYDIWLHAAEIEVSPGGLAVLRAYGGPLDRSFGTPTEDGGAYYVSRDSMYFAWGGDGPGVHYQGFVFGCG